MIQDRGKIKWRGMMLSEHVQALNDWRQEDGMMKRPELDEWDLRGIQEEIEAASKRKCQTRIETWIDGRLIPYQGTIEEIDTRSQCIMLEDPFGLQRIPVADIFLVRCIN